MTWTISCMIIIVSDVVTIDSNLQIDPIMKCLVIQQKVMN